MSRVTQFLWPVGALVVSFVVLFLLTGWLSTDRMERPDGHQDPGESVPSTLETPTPSPEPTSGNQATMTVTGIVVPTPASSPTYEGPLVQGILVLHGTQACLDGAFAAAGWKPDGDQTWRTELDGRTCRPVTVGEVLTVKLVQP